MSSSGGSGRLSPAVGPASVDVHVRVDCAGYLSKQGASRVSGFRRRWFELRDHKLAYYETRSATYELGVIDLINVSDVYPAEQSEWRLRA